MKKTKLRRLPPKASRVSTSKSSDDLQRNLIVSVLHKGFGWQQTDWFRQANIDSMPVYNGLVQRSAAVFYVFYLVYA